jgi:thioredoxin 1
MSKKSHKTGSLGEDEEKEKDATDSELEIINRRKLESMMSEIQRRKKIQAESATKSAPPGPDVKPILLTDANFSSEVSKHHVMVVDFWAPWCGPCRMVGPLIEQLAREYSGMVTFGKLNVDENPVVAGNFGIQSIPTMLVFQNGRAVDGLLGAVPKAEIESVFKPYLAAQ